MEPQKIKDVIIDVGGRALVLMTKIADYEPKDYRGMAGAVGREIGIEHNSHVASIRNPTGGVAVVWCLTCDSEVVIII